MALEYYVTNINDCVTDLNVNVTGVLPISDNEYSLNNCSIIQNNEWLCSCSKPIILNVATNTINNYTFIITYTIQQVQSLSSSSSGHRSSGSIIWYNFSYNNLTLYNQTEIINGTNITYPYYNITNEYKTLTLNVNPQPINNIQQNNIPVMENKKSVWERLWSIILEIFKIKLW